MVERIEHAEWRHEDIERPKSEAEQDKAAASEIYFDIESEHYMNQNKNQFKFGV